MERDFVVVIPARIGSGRLSRKPLAKIADKEMILHTYDRAVEATNHENVFIATDSKEVMQVCQSVGANVMMTSKNCATGTDRIAEFSTKIKAKIYINLQGDEPIMEAYNIRKMISAGMKNPNKIVNGWAKIESKREYFSRTIPKVVLRSNNSLMYMSRSPIPGNKENEFKKAKKQICIYSFPYRALKFLLENSSKSPIENIEDIEILRFLELGWDINMIELSGSSIAVDTPSDLARVRKILKRKSLA